MYTFIKLIDGTTWRVGEMIEYDKVTVADILLGNDEIGFIYKVKYSNGVTQEIPITSTLYATWTPM